MQGTEEFKENEVEDHEKNLVERIRKEKEDKYRLNSDDYIDNSQDSFSNISKITGNEPNCIFCEQPILNKDWGHNMITLLCDPKHKAHSDCVEYFWRHWGKFCPIDKKEINFRFRDD